MGLLFFFYSTQLAVLVPQVLLCTHENGTDPCSGGVGGNQFGRCLRPVTDILHLKIRKADMQSCLSYES